MEIEAKLSIPHRNLVETLARLTNLGDYQLRTGDTQDIEDTYFDTGDGQLRSAGYACRLRQIGESTFIGLKSLGEAQDGIHQREEYEQEIVSALPTDEWPEGKVREILNSIIGQTRLEPLCVLEQRRLRRHVYQGKRRIGELSLDTIQVKADEMDSTFFEAEVELARDGLLSDLRTLSQTLSEYGLLFESRPKLVHALEILGAVNDLAIMPRARQSSISADDAVADVATRVLGHHYKRLLKQESGTRKGKNIERLHQMRVATRRLRAALQIFGPYLPEKLVRRASKQLRRTAKVLGPVRDMDVLIERAMISASVSTANDNEPLAPLLEKWYAQREKARQRMLKHLNGDSYTKLKYTLEQLMDEREWASVRMSTPSPGKPSSLPLRYVMPGILWELYQRVWAYDTVLEDAAVKVLHALRVDCKRFRYALEAIEDALGEDARALIQPVKNAQEHLGKLNDAHVSCRLIERFLKERKAEEADALDGVKRYLSECELDVQKAIQTFPSIWCELVSVEYRQRLGEVLASL